MPYRRVRHPTPRALLVIEGECARPAAFSRHDLASIHAYYQVPDLSKVEGCLSGTAVRLRWLIDEVGPDFRAKYVTIHSEDGGFSACLPLDGTSRTALLVYAKDGAPLAREDGGPVRFVIPFSSDPCANVKGAARLVLSENPGPDTRPSTQDERKPVTAQ